MKSDPNCSGLTLRSTTESSGLYCADLGVVSLHLRGGHCWSASASEYEVVRLTEVTSQSIEGNLSDSPKGSNPWIGYSAVVITLVTIVMSMVTVALSPIAEHFNVTLRSVVWVVIVQGLTITALMMPMGRLGDIIGRRRVHLAGLVIFIVGTIVAATAG